MGVGLVRRTSSFGRKRISISNENEMDVDSVSPSKKRSTRKSFSTEDLSFLEALPQDLLIRVLCGVEHDDLKRLVQVSKLISEAAMIAKKLHFEYTTPKKVPAFRCPLEESSSLNFDEIKVPNAPRRLKVARSRLNRNKVGDNSVDSNDDDKGMSKKNLFYGIQY